MGAGLEATVEEILAAARVALCAPNLLERDLIRWSFEALGVPPDSVEVRLEIPSGVVYGVFPSFVDRRVGDE